MTILQRTGRYIFFVSVVMLLLQVAVVTAQNRKGGVTVSYESSGSSRVARFKNSNSFHVRVEFSYNGTRVHGSAEASGKDAVFVPANYSATYGGHGISITSVRITGVMRSDWGRQGKEFPVAARSNHRGVDLISDALPLGRVTEEAFT